MTRANNILQLRRKNIKNVARGSCAWFTSRTTVLRSRVEQGLRTLPPEVFQQGRPGADQFISRRATLQSLERVGIHQQAQVTINFPIGGKERMQRHGDFDPGEN